MNNKTKIINLFNYIAWAATAALTTSPGTQLVASTSPQTTEHPTMISQKLETTVSDSGL